MHVNILHWAVGRGQQAVRTTDHRDANDDQRWEWDSGEEIQRRGCTKHGWKFVPSDRIKQSITQKASTIWITNAMP